MSEFDSDVVDVIHPTSKGKDRKVTVRLKAEIPADGDISLTDLADILRQEGFGYELGEEPDRDAVLKALKSLASGYQRGGLFQALLNNEAIFIDYDADVPVAVSFP